MDGSYVSLSDNENTVYFCLFYCMNFCVWMAAVCPCQTMKTTVYFCLFYCMYFCVWMAVMCPCRTLKTILFVCFLLYEFLCGWQFFLSLSDNESYVLFLFVLLYEFLCVGGSFFSPCQTTKTIFVCFIVRLPLFGWQLRVAVGQRKNWVQSQGTEVCPCGRLGHIPPTQHPQEPHQQTQPLQPGNVCGVCVSVCLCACVLMGEGNRVLARTALAVDL